MMDAIREVIEAGYTFHGIHVMPSEEVAGYPGNSGINPAFRNALMHADVFDSFGGPRATTQQRIASHDRLNQYMNVIREATPGGGSYLNECDIQEPNWQQSFFGNKYNRLSQIKRERDPVSYTHLTLPTKA